MSTVAMASLVDLGKRLLEASKKGQAEEVSMLMTSGAPFTTDWLGTSPLHLAAQYGHTATAEVLLRAGVSRDARTKVDRTPIHLAAQHGHIDIVDLLIAGGASVNHTDMLNMTPLHWASDSGYIDIVRLLLKNGAKMDIESKFKQTPIDIARQKGFTDIVDMLLEEEASDRSQGIKRQSQTSLTLSTQIKKRTKTRKFPMTAGSWTGIQDPSNGQNLQVLRTHSETMAPLVSAAALASSEEKNTKKTGLKTEATSSQDSSVLDALATLATATLHQTTCLPAAAPTNTIAMAMSAVGKQNVTLSPLTIPPNIPSQLLGNIPSITPPMWGSVPPPQSPLTALSTISALSQPAQPSPLNIPMHQLPFAVPIGFNNQSGSASGNQLIITQVPVAGHQNVTAPSAQSTVTVSSITGSAVSSVVDQSSSSSDHTQSSGQTTAYLVPIVGAGPGGQGHLFLTAPDGTPQLVVDSGHQQQSLNVETTTSEKPNTQQQQQESVFQLQLTPAILQQLSQGSLDIQTPRQNVVHSILTQMPGQLPQIQMALAQVLPNQTESQTQVQTNTQNSSPHVLIQAVPLQQQQQQQESQSQTTQPAATEPIATTHQQLLQQLLHSQENPQVSETAQTSGTTTQANAPSTLIGSQLPATAALQNLLSQNLQGVSNTQTPAISQQQQKVFVDLQKIVETQERELRARRQLEERLEQARRDSRKFQTELQQAQKEAESYKDRLQAIKEKDTEDEPAVGSISGVSSGDQFARQLFIQPGSLEVLGTSNIMTDAADMLSQVAQETQVTAVTQVDETVVDEGDI